MKNLKSKTNSYFCKMFKKLLFTFLGFALISCAKETQPKPSGELRLEYPEAKYQKFTSPCNFDFEYSSFAKIENAKNPCWYYIDYPKMKAKVFITYFPVKNDLDVHVKESEKMVYEHTIKASSIDTKSFNYPERRVFGNFYELKGPTASNLQFFVTDSTRHYVTANLYFNTRPKPDSLAPAIDYIKKDLLHLIDTFNWK
ncbi:gliding motility-associated lipoprotein GldD [Kaistella jeonii]|nr:gliding motility-associated lipoprotein GldD [Kaistella jeonii]VEI97222.1 gliding motility-associated lipoprotein GldD [Kaistella jeonii]